MTITDEKVFSQAWHKIFETIKTISDPGGKSKWVFSSFPEKKIDEPEAYPLIVIPLIDVSYDPLTFTAMKRGPLTVTIDVYSTSSSQLDTISDSIVDKMETSEDAFMASGITVMRLVGTDYDHFTRNSMRIHNKTLTYEFDYGWS